MPKRQKNIRRRKVAMCVAPVVWLLILGHGDVSLGQERKRWGGRNQDGTKVRHGKNTWNAVSDFRALRPQNEPAKGGEEVLGPSVLTEHAIPLWPATLEVGPGSRQKSSEAEDGKDADAQLRAEPVAQKLNKVKGQKTTIQGPSKI